jgi:hypothetical protein
MAHASLSVVAEAEQAPGADIVHSANGVLARYKGLTLTSHFQPIFSVSHCRAIGHEGLLSSPAPRVTTTCATSTSCAATCT